MNLAASAIVLRPRGLGEVLDLTCRVGVTIARSIYLRVGLATLAPLFAGALALRYALDWSWASVTGVVVVATSVAQGPFTVAIGARLFSDEGAVLRPFLRRAPSFFAAMSFSYLLSLLSLGVAAPWLAFVREASLLENAGPMESIGRSARFVRGRWIDALGLTAVLLLTELAFGAVAEVLGQGLVADVLQLGHPFGSVLQDGGSPFALAGLVLATPFVATARFLRYVDIRTRSDGWDVQLRFMAVALADRERRGAS